MKRMMAGAAVLFCCCWGLRGTAAADEVTVAFTLPAGHTAPAALSVYLEKLEQAAWLPAGEAAWRPGEVCALPISAGTPYRLQLGELPAGYTLEQVTMNGEPRATVMPLVLPAGEAPQVTLALAQEAPPRYAAQVTLRAPVAEERVLTLLADGCELTSPADVPATLAVSPEGALTLALPPDYPLALAAVTWAGEPVAIEAGACALSLAPELFTPASGRQDLRTAVLEVTLTPAVIPPAMEVLPLPEPMEPGESARRILRVTNSALLAQQVQVGYLPDTLRWAISPAPEAEPSRIDADGSFCWERLVPAAEWTEAGEIIPAVVEIPFELTALPLPEGLGFAQAEDAWTMAWTGGEASEALLTQLAAPVLTGTLTADAAQVTVGEQVIFTVRISNTGGAAGQALVSMGLPAGFRFQPLPGEFNAPEVVGDMLLWRVVVPGAATGQAGEATLRFGFEMGPDALDEQTGYRVLRCIAWMDGGKLPELALAIAAPRLTVARAFSQPAVTPGETVTLRLAATNAGGAPATVELRQKLPEGVTYLPDPRDEHAPAVAADGTLTWRLEVPAAEMADDRLGKPGMAERTARLKVLPSLLQEHEGGRRALATETTLDGEPIDGQTLLVRCPEVVVQAVSVPGEVTAGAACTVALTVRNRGGAEAVVRVEADIPAGFSFIAGEQGGAPALVGRTLNWQFPLAADGAQDIAYGLRANSLPAEMTERQLTHLVRVRVAQDDVREAARATTRVTRPGFWATWGGEWWIVLLSALCCAVCVVCIHVARKTNFK